MKIAVDTRSLSSKNMTGVAYYLYNSLDNLIKNNASISWQLLSSGLKNKPQSYWSEQPVKYSHLRWPNKLINFFATISFGRSIADQVDEDVDLLWLPSINFFIHRHHKPFVLTIHDLSFLHSHSFYSLRMKIWHRLVNVKKLISQASAVIVVSENTKRDMVRFFSSAKDKIFVVYPGVEHEKMTSDEARTLTAHLNLPTKFFLFVGTLEPRKNVPGLIKAFDRLHAEYPDYALVLVGSRGWMYSQLLRDIKKRHYIRYLGYQEKPIKDAFYKLSYAFIWPSFYEGFGFPPLEALAHHKPVISSYKTSLPEILRNQAIYVDPYNVSDMYRAMKMLIEDQHLYLSLITENLEVPQWPKQSQEILDIFKKIII